MWEDPKALHVQLVGLKWLHEGQEGAPFTLWLQNKKQLCLVSFLTSVMNQEMPMAARSTSTRFNTCHPHPKRGNHTHIHTRGSPSGVFVFLFVSICYKSGTWHLLGEQTSPMRPPGLPYVLMQTNTHHAKVIKRKGKYEPWTSQYNMHPCCLLYSHTKITACHHMNIPLLIKYSRRLFFPLSLC